MLNHLFDFVQVEIAQGSKIHDLMIVVLNCSFSMCQINTRFVESLLSKICIYNSDSSFDEYYYVQIPMILDESNLDFNINLTTFDPIMIDVLPSNSLRAALPIQIKLLLYLNCTVPNPSRSSPPPHSTT